MLMMLGFEMGLVPGSCISVHVEIKGGCCHYRLKVFPQAFTQKLFLPCPCFARMHNGTFTKSEKKLYMTVYRQVTRVLDGC